MNTVYLIQSVRYPNRHYTGLTSDFRRRLHEHNAGTVISTRSFRPWRAVVTIQFEDDAEAVAFERYLKSGSGQAFANRHLR